jgi:hypothetical protein
MLQPAMKANYYWYGSDRGVMRSTRGKRCCVSVDPQMQASEVSEGLGHLQTGSHRGIIKGKSHGIGVLSELP